MAPKRQPLSVVSGTPRASASTRSRESRSALQTPLETYLREINETALLSADDEQELAERIASRGQAVRLLPSLDRLMDELDDAARPGDVLMTMGAGDINRIQHELTRRLQRHSATR